MHHPTDRMTHTTAFVTPVVEHCLEREIAQWVRPMKERSYHGATSRSLVNRGVKLLYFVLVCLKRAYSLRFVLLIAEFERVLKFLETNFGKLYSST